MRNILSILILLHTFINLRAATYYSQSSGALNSTSRWNTARNGSGSSHDAIYGNTHTYIIQNGHSITSSSSPNVGNSSSQIIIENGGTYTHTSSTSSTLTLGTLRIEGGGLYVANRTGQSLTNVNIYSGGKLIHNSGSNTLIGTNRNYSNANNGGNGDGTYEIRNHGVSAIAGFGGWGNLIINNSGSQVILSGTHTIAGNLEITAGALNLGTSITHFTSTLSFAGIAQNGGSWGSNSSSATNKNNTYFTSGITGIITNSSSLPVELILFEGFFNGKNNIIQWKTSSEHNSSHFILENSIDGENWNTIYLIDAAGNSTELIHYEYTQSYFINEFNYYILHQWDIDGVFKTYGPISIDNRSNLKLEKIVNLMGQRVNTDFESLSGIYLEVYNNGTCKKIIK